MSYIAIDQIIFEEAGFLKRAFVRVLKTVFAHESIPPQYRYSKNRPDRKVSIRSEYPKTLAPPTPWILVEAKTSDMSIKQLGEEVIARDFDVDDITGKKVEIAKYLGGVVWTPMVIEVRAKTPNDRECLMALISSYMRGPARTLFLANDCEFLDIQSDPTGTDELPSGDLIFTGEVRVQVQSQTTIKINTDLENKVRKISIADLRYAIGTEPPATLDDEESE